MDLKKLKGKRQKSKIQDTCLSAIRDCNMEKNKKLKKLKDILKKMKGVVVAFSGGVDSTFLLKVAVDTLGKKNVLAVTARSESYPQREFAEAKSLAKIIGAQHMIMNTSELKIKNFKNNPADRCYYCKKELFSKLMAIAKKKGFFCCADGTNYDDLRDTRYGMIASKELGVRSPLLEAKMTKADIRHFSRKLGLKTWNKPAFACLASRFPARSTISRKKLKVVERAEDFLISLGVTQVRVRHYGKIARIEVYPDDMNILIKKVNRSIISKKFKKLGFLYTTVDLEGYKTGSMNKN